MHGSIFSFLRPCQLTSTEGASVGALTGGVWTFLFPQPHWHFWVLFCFVFTDDDHSDGGGEVRWNRRAAFNCIPLMATDVEHFFTHLLFTCVSSLENCLLSSFTNLVLQYLILSRAILM